MRLLGRKAAAKTYEPCPLARLFLAVLLALALTPAAARPAEASATLPDGFRLESIATGQPAYNLSSFAFVPGGMLTLGRSGLITMVPPGGAPRAIGTVPGVMVRGDLGALGLAMAPDFVNTGFVYLAYNLVTPDGEFARISRWALSPAAAPSSDGGRARAPPRHPPRPSRARDRHRARRA